MTMKPNPPKPENATVGTREGRMFASIILWFFVALILCSIAGVWFKLFWLGMGAGGEIRR